MSFIGLISFPLLSIGMLNGLSRRNTVPVVDPWGPYKIMGVTSAYGTIHTLIEQKSFGTKGLLPVTIFAPVIVSGAIYCVGLQIGKEIPLKLFLDLKK